ncbi:MAG: ferritin-like domain-containing protein, partial [Actinomycetota bacterium]|nr:ferritin-like domain-containing protein [Actinomycetota bacterium]
LALGEGPGGADAPAARALAGVPVTNARDALVAFARETRRQHDEHKKAFQAQTKALDANATVQDAPNPKFLPLVATADLSTAAKLVDFAAVLEKVATDSYLLNLTMLRDTRTKAIMGSVMAVEAQHLATLRTVGALLAGGAPELVAVPLPLSATMKLPPATGRAGFPDALHTVGGADLVADPASGAVR